MALVVWIASVLPAFCQARHVVLLYDERTDLPGLAMLDAGIVRTLTSGSPEPIEVYRETMDLSRFDSTGYRNHLRNHLRAKYAAREIDVVVAVMEPALDVLLSHRDEVFPGAPIVFCGIDRRQLGVRPLPSDVTGVLLKREFTPTLELALRLHPETDRIVVVAGVSEFDARLLAQAREEFRPFEDRFTFNYLTNLPLPALLSQLAQLPPKTVVLYSTVFRDGAGDAFVPHDVAERVSEAASVPVYGFVDQYLGRGIVGGSLYSLEAHGEKAAKLVQMILSGRKPGELPLIEPGSSVTMFDSRQLQRWKISRRRLPPGSEVRFHTPTLWSRFKWQMIGMCLVVLGQAVLIVVLMKSRRRSQRLTKDLEDSKSQLLQNRAELQDLLRFERLSADISSTLMRVEAENLGKQIVPAMGQVARLLGFDAATLAIFSRDGTALLPHVWHAPETPGLPANLTDKDFPWSARELLAGRDVHIRTLNDFPPEAQTDRATYERYGLKSALDVPVIVSGQPVGVLSMGSFRKEQALPPQIIERQRVLGNILGNALVRARTEIALRQSEKRLALAATAGDLGLWFWNLQNNAVWMTERAKTMFGFAPESELTYEMFYARVHPEDRRAVAAGIAGAISGKADYEAEYRICLPGDAEKWIAARGEVAFENGGRPVSMTGIASDITERRRNAMELFRHRQELAHISRISIMGELSASMAHELNQPLTAILSNSQAGSRFLAESSPNVAEVREVLQDIAQDTKRAGEIIRQMRKLVKRGDLQFEALDLKQVIHDVTRLLHSDTVIRNVRITLDFQTELPPVRGDAVQLQQVLLNLLLNAFDAMKDVPESERTACVRTRRLDANSAQIEVSDRGTGIQPEKLAGIFEPFHTTKPEGLGLGLSISRSIVESHGGRLSAKNNPDRGASFYFDIPIDSAPGTQSKANPL